MADHKQPKGLGKGLSALFGEDPADAKPVTGLKIRDIEPSPNQPRHVFDEQALNELADSIRQNGVITPIMARSADKFAAEDNDKGISAILLANGFLFDVTFGVIGFVAFMFGGDAVSALVNSIPAWLTTGITIATGILPALGFAQLVTMIVSKETAVFLLLGFLLAAYLGVPVLGIVCFAVVLVGVLMMAHIFIPSQGSALETEVDDDNEF